MSGTPSVAVAGRLNQEIGIDDALQRTVGEFGRGQQLFYCLAQLAWVPAAMQTFAMLYTGLDPITQHWFSCRHGDDHKNCSEILNGDFKDPSIQFCKLPPGSYIWSRRGDSIVSEWDLVCDNLWKQEAVNSCFFAGFLIGAGLFGTLADRLGRKRALFMSLLVGGLSGIFCGLSTSYWAYAFFRFVTGIGVAGMGMVAYILGCEYVGPSWRGFLGVAAHYFFAVGAILMPFLAYYIPNWRTLSLLTSSSSLLYTLVLPSLPESPRWQLISGRKGDATATLAAIASYNGTHLPDVPLTDMAVTSGTGAGMGDVLRHPVLKRRLLVQIISWFTASSTYYGISLMVADLPGSVYTNNAILASVEIASYFGVSMLVERVGRRWTVAGSYLLAGVCLILSACTSGTLRTVFAVGAKCGAAAALALIILFAAELFPTVVRSACIGASSQAARIGGMVTPAIILAAHEMHVPLLAFTVLGLLSTLAGVLLLTQPETLGIVLPETIQDVPLASPRKPARVNDLEWPAMERTLCISTFYNRSRGFIRMKGEEDVGE